MSEISDDAYIKAADKFIGREIRHRPSGATIVSVWYNVSDGTDGGEYQDCEVKISKEEAFAAQAELDAADEISDAEIDALSVKYLDNNVVLGNGREIVRWILADYEAARKAMQ